MIKPPDIKTLYDQLDAAEQDARSVVEGLGEEQGRWRASVDSWSVAQCLDHLGITNEVYLGSMLEPATRARSDGRLRRRPALPGPVGRWFVARMQPPVKQMSRIKTMRNITPSASPALADALARFLRSQDDVRKFLDNNADLDLASIRFPNLLVRGIRFSVATGLHVITAHDRRHLWQAWRVRRAAEGGRAIIGE